MMAAAALIGRMEQPPRRSIRVLLFAAEEIGLVGAAAYYDAHQDELDENILGAEVDGQDYPGGHAPPDRGLRNRVLPGCGNGCGFQEVSVFPACRYRAKEDMN